MTNKTFLPAAVLH